jgi:hypothetical protein
MGLLEEAIREHLELQRRRGGDPRQIALAEQEALEPLVPGHTPEWAQGPVLFDGEHSLANGGMRPVSQNGAYEVAPEAPAAQDAAAGSYVRAEPHAPADRSAPADPSVSAGAGIEQETAELDMSIVLFDSPANDAGPAPQHASLQPPGLAGPVDEPSQPVPEFGAVRARRIVTDPAPAASGEPDFEWEIPGVTGSPRAGA